MTLQPIGRGEPRANFRVLRVALARNDNGETLKQQPRRDMEIEATCYTKQKP